MTVVTRWWLIRHAPVINPEGCVYGQQDIDCDVTDGPAFGHLARGLPEAAVWLCTPLTRTRKTAEAIRAAAPAAAPRPALEVEPGLLEQHFGAWQGLTHAQIDALPGGRRIHPFWRAPAYLRPPGGESFADVVARVGMTLEQRSEAHAGRDVVAVCHGGSIRAALAVALGLDPGRALGFRIDTLSLTRIDHIADGAAPVTWRVSHVNLPPAACPGLG